MKGIANVGDVLAGKYRVDKILGIGGMGMVVAATHVEIDQPVAIKFMLPAAMESAEAPKRFEREARAAGRLTSEHVCRVHDVGKFETGAPYIVMEYLEGYDLGTLLKRRGPLLVGEAVDYIIQACEGMAEAHSFGIIHRDLKPDNLFLAVRNDGTQIVKVLDFGISKANATGIATRTGDVMGSPAYMAPEQMQSTKDVDQAADIWSLGVVLYQIISGRMPFVADTLPALCMSVINDAPPSLASIRKDMPPGLAEVVMRCLAKDKSQRYQSVGELARALAPFGLPESQRSLTRINGVLARRRQPTPPPLMMLPSEFSDVVGGVAPTLMSSSDSLDIHISKDDAIASSADVSGVKRAGLPGLPPRAEITTIGSAAGESSIGLETKRILGMPVGFFGAIAGGIALIALIVVMAMMKKGANADPAQDPPTPVTSPRGDVPKVDPPALQPKIEPKVDPIVTPDTAGSGSGGAKPGVTVVEDSGSAKPHGGDSAQQVQHPKTPKTIGSVRKDPKDTKDPKSTKDSKDTKDTKDPKDTKDTKDPKGTKDPKNPKDPKDTKDTKDPGDNAPPPPPPDDDEKWGHMHHDQPPAGSGSAK
jgi:eukaryotic-like serine/threonine-protein kinase